LGGDITGYPTIEFQEASGLNFRSTSDVDGDSFNCTIRGFNTSNNTKPQFHVNIIRDWMYNYGNFNLNSEEAVLEYENQNFQKTSVRISEAFGTGLYGPTNIWKLDNNPDGSVDKAIATVKFVKDFTGDIQTYSRVFTSNEIHNSLNNPIVIINAPGNNKWIKINEITCFLDWNSDGYDSQSYIDIEYETSDRIYRFSLNGTQDKLGAFTGYNNYTDIGNKAITVKEGNVTSDGDSPVTIKIKYEIMDY
jgi:hypothetical protein